MLEFLSRELRDGLEAAHKRRMRRKSRMHIRLGDAVYPVLRMWEGGFSLEPRFGHRLRGLVDLYDGPRHILQCLIVASTEDGGEIRCEFKRVTQVTDRPPADFWRGEAPPAGYLPRA